MKHLFISSTLCAILTLTACGGTSDDSGDNDSSQAGNTTITPTPQITDIQLSADSGTLSVEFTEGDNVSMDIGVYWSAGPDVSLTGKQVYLQVSSANNYFTSLTVDATNSEALIFAPPLTSSESIAAGIYSDIVSVRACEDDDCSTPYTNSRLTLLTTLTVNGRPAWSTHQGNAAHTGYVPIIVGGTDFPQLWQWQYDLNGSPVNYPASGNGIIYTSMDVYFGDASLVAISEEDGSELWRHEFTDIPGLNPPAVGDNYVYVSVTGHDDTYLYGLNKETGELVTKTGFSFQWGNELAPTPYGDRVYQTGGYDGGSTYAIRTSDGLTLWEETTGSSWGLDTPAVDDDWVYVYYDQTLSKINRSNGDLDITIHDENDTSISHYYTGSPVIGDNNMVYAFSGAANGNGSSEHIVARVITAFDMTDNAVAWSTSDRYIPYFALADGIIYAGCDDPLQLQALDAKSGTLLWTWEPTSGTDTGFHRNIIATSDLIFASTDKYTYAISRSSHQTVWSTEEPGMLSITPNRHLVIATGAEDSDGRIVTYDLNQ